MPALPNDVATPEYLAAVMEGMANSGMADYGPIGTPVRIIPLNSPLAIAAAAASTTVSTVQVANNYEYIVVTAMATAWAQSGGDINTPSTTYALSSKIRLLAGEINPIQPTEEWQPLMGMFGSGKQPGFIRPFWFWPAGSACSFNIRNESGVALYVQMELQAFRRPRTQWSNRR